MGRSLGPARAWGQAAGITPLRPYVIHAQAQPNESAVSERLDVSPLLSFMDVLDRPMGHMLPP